MKVVFYISGHGFGHATRMVATMDALIARRPTTRAYVRTQAPRSLFAGIPASSLDYHSIALDAGVVEKDVFSQDVYSALLRYSEISASRDFIVSSEVTFAKNEGIDIIVSDIPPLASEIGHAAGIRTLAIANFSWDFIYEPYLRSYPSFAGLIDEIRASYAKTDMLLRLPFHHDMMAFPRHRDIPLIARRPTSRPENTRLRLRIPASDSRAVILVALRMSDVVPRRAIQELIDSGEFTILSFAPLPCEASDNVRVLSPDWQPPEFPDIVAISDLVVSKLGYGIVADCIAGKTPLMYVPRDDFAEYDLLKGGMRDQLPSYLMPRDDFLQGNWYDHIKTFLSGRFDWVDVRTDGAEVAADAILSDSA